MKIQKIVVFLVVIFCLCLSSCKETQNGSSIPDKTDVGISEITSDSSDTLDSQETDVKTDNTSSVPDTTDLQTSNIISDSDDSKDPENTENILGDGNKIQVQEVQKKTGKMNGIDVSYWQGKIDWKAVKSDGVDFAIIRIGYRGEDGKLYRDNNAHYNIQQAQKADVLVGVYFFSTAVNTKEAVEEASFVIDFIKGYKISCPVVYDCEGYQKEDSRMYNLTNEKRTQNALSFLQKITKAGYQAMFYGAKNDIEYNRCWDTDLIESKYKIWVAFYSTPAYPQVEIPDYSGKYDMWQYTNRGQVNGIKGNCDLIVSYDVYKKSSQKDKDIKNETAQAPKTDEEKIYTDVSDSVTAKEVVNLRSGAGTNYDIVGTLKSGDFLKRTGVGKNGWSRLKYNGKTVYAISSYLTDKVIEKPKKDIVNGMEFTPKDDKVTPKMEVNLRRLPTTDSESVGKIVSGTFLKRTAISTGGWSRLLYNGKTVYAVSSYLTDKAPEISSKPIDNKNITEHGMVFEKVTPINITAKKETNLREAPTTDSNIVYTLKNGEYVTKNAISNSGWARLEYDGKIVYAVDSFLIGAE